MKQSVTVYYDETHMENNLNGHVLFFVPDQIEIPCTQSDNTGNPRLFDCPSYTYYPCRDLIKEVTNLRGNKFQYHKFHFNEISGRHWTEQDKVTYNLLATLVDSLRSKGCQRFQAPLCCKVAVLYYPENKKKDLYGGKDNKEKKLRYDETMLRILLKGACHYLYDKDHAITISNFIVDGFPAHRELDDNRIIWKLFAEEGNNRTQLRDYVQFDPNITITHIDSVLRNYAPGSVEFEHANFLQCADLLLGSISYSLFKPPWEGKKHIGIKELCTNKKGVLSENARYMLGKVSRGYGFTTSGHYKSFSVSRLLLEHGKIIFQDAEDLIVLQDQQNNSNQPSEQMVLDFFVQ